MLGNFHDNVINIECETNSADLYVVDAEGVYIENIALHSYLESDVINAINAKYGTNFTHLTMFKVTGIAIGDDCPNWNAYEKILLPAKIFVAASLGNNGFSIGYILQNKYVFYAENDQNTYVMSMQGNVIAKNVPIETSWNYRVKPALKNNGYENVTEYLTETKIYDIGDNVENIGEYQFIE